VAAFEIRQPVTAAKFITKSSLFIAWLYPSAGLKPNGEQKVEHIIVTPPYSQTACCLLDCLTD
jgi:hypothetical protein